MREIKFRAISQDTGNWLFGNLVDSGLTEKKEYFILPEDANNYDEFDKVNPETIGQFTGLKDKNGKDIYESDILQLDNDKNLWVIKYSGCGFRGEPTDKNELLKGYHLTNNNYLQFQVIGNIHENSELL